MTLVCADDPYDVSLIGFDCPRLPFAPAALEPVLSCKSVLEHHGQHEKYCKKALHLAEETDSRLLDLPLIEVVRLSAYRDPGVELYRQASQAWNHAFLWLSFRQDGTRRPSRWDAMRQDEFEDTVLGSLAIKSGFEGFPELQEAMIAKAAASFASQWLWLVSVGDELDVVLTDDADSPIMDAGVLPLLVVDLWEHAYHKDHPFARVPYAKAVIEKLLDWERADVLLTLERC